MKIRILLSAVLIICFVNLAFGELTGKKCAIIVSNRYKPYMDVEHGFSKEKEVKVEVFYLVDNPKKIEIELKKNKYDFIVAVGVQSLSFVKKFNLNIPVFYSLLVYPPDNMSDVCGVYLQPAPEKLVKILHNEYPSVNNLIIPATSKDSLHYIKKLEKSRSHDDLSVTVIDLKSIKKILINSRHENRVFLFIPDELFSSDILIKEIIDLVRNKFHVVGYNPFFCAVGAEICFEDNYFNIGIQTRNLVKRYFETGVCESESAEFLIKHRGDYEKK